MARMSSRDDETRAAATWAAVGLLAMVATMAGGAGSDAPSAAPGSAAASVAVSGATAASPSAAPTSAAALPTGCEALRQAPAAAADAAAATPLSAATARGDDGLSRWHGRAIVVRGAVTRVVSDGYFLQDPFASETPVAGADGPPALRVYTGRAAPTVSPGDVLQVSGRMSAWRTGNPPRPPLELAAPRDVRVLATGCAIAPVALTWAGTSEAALQALEGRLVRIVGPLTVQENRFLGRFGTLVLAAGGRRRQATELTAPRVAPAQAATDSAASLRLWLDDGSGHAWPSSPPAFGPGGEGRVGDDVPALVGVLDRGPAGPGLGATTGAPLAWRLQPTTPVRVLPANPRPASPPDVGGDVRVATANLENFFVTPADARRGCGPHHLVRDCRGARDGAELARQRAKLATMLQALDADVLALQELQNDGDDAASALAAALDERLGRHAWSVVAGAPGGHDAIRVGLIYRADRVRPVGGPRTDADPVHSRPPLAQVFEWPGGARLRVVAVHFKSKRCESTGAADSADDGRDGEGDAGDGQGCFAARRAAQARAMVRFVDALARERGPAGRPDTLLLGDFNAYAREDAVAVLAAAGYTDLAALPSGERPFAYTYVHDGLAGSLDHAFASPGLRARVTSARAWHVNADEPDVLDYRLSHRQGPACASCAPDRFDPATPWRASDHDPLLVGLRLGR